MGYTLSSTGRDKLICDGAVKILDDGRVEHNCHNPVTHIDRKGYAYCTAHGERRQQHQPCRKMRPHEIKRLEQGLPLKAY